MSNRYWAFQIRLADKQIQVQVREYPCAWADEKVLGDVKATIVGELIAFDKGQETSFYNIDRRES